MLIVEKTQHILKWCAQYLESVGDSDAALGIYEKIKDWPSVIRILCIRSQLDEVNMINK